MSSGLYGYPFQNGPLANMGYGVGGDYQSTVGAGLNQVITYANSPYTSSNYSPYGQNPPVFPPPSDTYVPSSPPAQNPAVQAKEASFQQADDRLEQERQTAIQDGRTDLLPAIDGQIQAIDTSEQQLQA